jgi:putative aldouronate transport system permease protein
LKQTAAHASAVESKISCWKRLRIDVRKDWDLYALLIPGICFVLLFKYTPMYGIMIAFKDFNIFDGVQASPWVGFNNFEKLFHSPDFLQVFENMLISVRCFNSSSSIRS